MKRSLTDYVKASEYDTRYFLQTRAPLLQRLRCLAEFEHLLDGRLHVRVNAPRVRQHARQRPSRASHAGHYLGLLEAAKMVVLCLMLGGCTSSPDASIDPAFTEAQAAQVADAVETWRALCPSREVVPQVVLDCERVQAPAYGRTIRYYGESVIYLCPADSESQRADAVRVVALHELGHYLGAEHSPEADSVMQSHVSVEALPGDPSTADLAQAGCL